MSENTLQRVLYSVGVFRHYCGFAYLEEAVSLAAEDTNRLLSIQKEIYYPVAKKYHTNVHNVEKDIRTVRDILIRNGGEKILEELTGYTLWKDKKPYPKELIGIFAECLQKESHESLQKEAVES